MKKNYFIIISILVVLIAGCSMPKVNLFKATPDPLREYTLEGAGADKILLVYVNGMISDNSKKGAIFTTPSLVEQVVAQIYKAEKDKQIKADLFKINYPGGTITASDLLYHEISSYKEKTGNKIGISMMDHAKYGA